MSQQDNCSHFSDKHIISIPALGSMGPWRPLVIISWAFKFWTKWQWHHPHAIGPIQPLTSQCDICAILPLTELPTGISQWVNISLLCKTIQSSHCPNTLAQITMPSQLVVAIEAYSCFFLPVILLPTKYHRSQQRFMPFGLPDPTYSDQDTHSPVQSVHGP